MLGPFICPTLPVARRGQMGWGGAHTGLCSCPAPSAPKPRLTLGTGSETMTSQSHPHCTTPHHHFPGSSLYPPNSHNTNAQTSLPHKNDKLVQMRASLLLEQTSSLTTEEGQNAICDSPISLCHLLLHSLTTAVSYGSS